MSNNLRHGSPRFRGPVQVTIGPGRIVPEVYGEGRKYIRSLARPRSPDLSATSTCFIDEI